MTAQPIEKRPHFQVESRTACCSSPFSPSRIFASALPFAACLSSYPFAPSIDSQQPYFSFVESPPLPSPEETSPSRRCNEARTGSRPLLYTTPCHSMCRQCPTYDHHLRRRVRRSRNTRGMAGTLTNSSKEGTRATCLAVTGSS